MRDITNIEDCPYFEGCKSPLCPLDKGFKEAVWYANEDICVTRAFRRERWRIVQRKIKKVNDTVVPVIGYFTLDMLLSIKRISKKVQGCTGRKGEYDQYKGQEIKY